MAKEHSTNYRNTLITVAGDCSVSRGTRPEKAGSIAQLQLALLQDQPYALTSDDILFEVHAMRNAIAPDERAAARAVLFAKPQACLRASPLVKTCGWGLHHDDTGHVAAFGMETEEYARLLARSDVKKVPGMRSRRG